MAHAYRLDTDCACAEGPLILEVIAISSCFPISPSSIHQPVLSRELVFNDDRQTSADRHDLLCHNVCTRPACHQRLTYGQAASP